MLGVEFLNEWFSNLLAAVLPAVKSALGLNYVQVSLLFTLLEGTDVVSDGIFGVIGDLWPRRLLITGGTAKKPPLLVVPPTTTVSGPVDAPFGTGTTMLVLLQLVGAADKPLNRTVLVP